MAARPHRNASSAAAEVCATRAGELSKSAPRASRPAGHRRAVSPGAARAPEIVGWSWANSRAATAHDLAASVSPRREFRRGDRARLSRAGGCEPAAGPGCARCTRWPLPGECTITTPRRSRFEEHRRVVDAAAVGEEHQVATTQLPLGDPVGAPGLGRGGARDLDAGPAEAVLHQPRAVEGPGSGGAVPVAVTDLLQGDLGARLTRCLLAADRHRPPDRERRARGAPPGSGGGAGRGCWCS